MSESTNRAESRWRSPLLALLTVTAALYLPYFWVLITFNTVPQEHRVLAIAGAPVLIPSIVLTALGFPNWPVANLLLLLLIIAAFTAWGARGPEARFHATVCAFTISCVLSILLSILTQPHIVG